MMSSISIKSLWVVLIWSSHPLGGSHLIKSLFGWSSFDQVTLWAVLIWSSHPLGGPHLIKSLFGWSSFDQVTLWVVFVLLSPPWSACSSLSILNVGCCYRKTNLKKSPLCVLKMPYIKQSCRYLCVEVGLHMFDEKVNTYNKQVSSRVIVLFW